MTALSSYRIRSSNGSENVSSSIFSGFTPVDVSSLAGSGLSEDDMELVSYLSPVLQYLGSLCPSFESAGYANDNPPCVDPSFVAALFVYYRYLWDVVRIYEENPHVCLDPFVPAVPVLRISLGGWDDDNGCSEPIYLGSFSCFSSFMCSDVVTYRHFYMYYVLTGEIDLESDVETLIYLSRTSCLSAQEVH